jgi:hypothetical protein
MADLLVGVWYAFLVILLLAGGTAAVCGAKVLVREVF